MAKEKRASWWKMFNSSRAVIRALTDEEAGKALKVAFDYFNDEEVDLTPLSSGAYIAFSVFQESIDEAKRDYARSVEDGKKGGRRKINNEAESNGKNFSVRFTPPTLEEVREYCKERSNAVDAQRFIDHYTSNGWIVGKTPMQDWRASVRLWEKNGRLSVPDARKLESGKDPDRFAGLNLYDLDGTKMG